MPHYDRHAVSVRPRYKEILGGDPEGDAMETAAEAIRQAEVEAVRTDGKALPADVAKLEQMSIDELRVLATELDVPDRGKITKQDALIDAIRWQLRARRAK